ncbi:hypothetical protein BC939DRAFT_532444 [Gamsiella multidivaricata]|uniref:uncharacterized protein n=1 Tax=Gamsiella multidivaricata TaxID=101098 RepID=UPI002220EA06|nr:uncharacterized protein BC939DRAFT_532444 [Gamsiella multidivaricata]KAI7817875.1 hypothetical protein BC939DRAFT_532444 [Gamsiella multidivaricata]
MKFSAAAIAVAFLGLAAAAKPSATTTTSSGVVTATETSTTVIGITTSITIGVPTVITTTVATPSTTTAGTAPTTSPSSGNALNAPAKALMAVGAGAFAFAQFLNGLAICDHGGVDDSIVFYDHLGFVDVEYVHKRDVFNSSLGLGKGGKPA